MIEFWAKRIGYNTERLGEVPPKLQEKVKEFLLNQDNTEK